MSAFRRCMSVAARVSHQLSVPRATALRIVPSSVASRATRARHFSLTTRSADDGATSQPAPPSSTDAQGTGEYPGFGFSEPLEMKARSVFVSNAPIDAKESDIKEYFSHVAPVDFVVKGPTALYYWVYFKDAETASMVQQKMDNIFWLGRMLRVKPRIIKTVPEGQLSLMDPTPTLFIGNMPFTMTDPDLNELSKRLEYSFDIRVAVDRASGWPRGYCHADFYNTALATRALYRCLKEPIEMGSNRLRLNFAAPSKSKSYDFESARRKALMYSHRTIDFYDDLAEKLRVEEGEWVLTAEMLRSQPVLHRGAPPPPNSSAGGNTGAEEEH